LPAHGGLFVGNTIELKNMEQCLFGKTGELAKALLRDFRSALCYRPDMPLRSKEGFL